VATFSAKSLGDIRSQHQLLHLPFDLIMIKLVKFDGSDGI
jgi:hypothetical protein